MLSLIGILFGSVCPAMADGLKAIDLQALLRSSPNAGSREIPWQNLDLSGNPITVGDQTISLASVGAQQVSATAAIQNLAQAVAKTVQSNGGDVSLTSVTIPAATTVRNLSSKLAEHVSVLDFGAVGGATTAYLASAANAGDGSLALSNPATISKGEIVDGPGVAKGTIVSSVTVQSGSQTTVVGLSTPLTASASAGQRYDFAVQDDYPAFLAAQASGAKYVEVPAGPTREYYLSGYAGNVPGVVWKLDGAYFAQNGGLVEGVNQSMTQNLNSEALLNTMRAAGGEDTLLVTAANLPSGSTASYQKNVVHVQLNQADASTYSFLGDPKTIVRDLVGYSVQGHCPTGNVKCSMFGSEALMTMDPSSDGSITGYEISIANLSGYANTEMGSWNNKSALTLISSGSTMGAALWVNGRAWQTGVDLSTAILGKAWVVRTEGARNAAGLSTTHADYAYADHVGNVFAQTAHIGGGGPTAGDTDPTGGVTIFNDPAGRLAIGNSTLTNGAAPSLEFHFGSGAAADTYSTRFVQTLSGLQLQTSQGAASATSHPDGSTEFGGIVIQTHAAGLAASASNTLVLSAHYNTVATCPTGSTATLLSGMPTGSDVYVLNRCGASFSLTASVNIEGNAPGVGVPVPAGSTQHYYLESATQWRQLQ